MLPAPMGLAWICVCRLRPRLDPPSVTYPIPARVHIRRIPPFNATRACGTKPLSAAHWGRRLNEHAHMPQRTALHPFCVHNRCSTAILVLASASVCMPFYHNVVGHPLLLGTGPVPSSSHTDGQWILQWYVCHTLIHPQLDRVWCKGHAWPPRRTKNTPPSHQHMPPVRRRWVSLGHPVR